ncbi:MAG: three-Cys-motif partner protein TcmP [Nitrospinae bacterium]|nr:three-Cys-motif partner protein TcmP [Nitrospinota bacterium]
MQFKWHPDEPPPILEEHSKAKLDVLRYYLSAYFDRLNVIFSRDEFKLDLVDGFSGGGIFRDSDNLVSGTPLIMLEESIKANDRWNEKRTKPLHFDCKYYFVDKDAAHTDYLKKVLAERGHKVDNEKILIHNNRFENIADDIIAEIHRRQPMAGRSIFLLDQTGFSQVELALVERIFRKLRNAEVILTFATDSLVNFLVDRPEIVKAVSPLDMTADNVREWAHLKNGDGGRALIQRALRPKIRLATGATFDTPFFIRPIGSRRALWFLHLSRHPIARDVMIQCHWEVSNKFEHYGRGDFGMLGWEALESKTFPLFHFTGMDAKQMREGLLESMPEQLFILASEQPVTIDAIRHRLANETAARFLDLDQVILTLAREREFEILGPDGKVRSQKLKHLRSTDRIAISKQMRLFTGPLYIP